ncbi:hypothetical protein AB5N19_03415 [Seiridium cardinale]
MSFSKFAALRCNRMPAMPDLAIKFINALDKKATYDDLWDIVVEMAKDLQRSPFRTRSIEQAFEKHPDDLRDLLYTIHRDVLRSIVQQTLIYDFKAHDSPNWKFVYSSDGPGTYAAGFGILDRDNAIRDGLTRRETKKLVQLLEVYVFGCKAWILQGGDDGHGVSQLDHLHTEALRFVAHIDGIFPLVEDPESDDENEGNEAGEDGDSDADVVIEDTEYDSEVFTDVTQSPGDWQQFDRPRFASGSASRSSAKMTRNIQQMIDMFRYRYRRSNDANTEQVQVPICVGNADDIEKRKQSYKVSGSLLNSAKLFGLTMSCLSYLGHQPFEVFVPIIKAWKPIQINLGEILVTVLGGSAVSAPGSGGFNVHPPGLKPRMRGPTKRTFERAQDEVYKQPWFEENLLFTREAQLALVRKEELDKMNKTTSLQLEAAVDDYEQALSRWSSTLASFNSAKQDAENRLAQQERACQRAQELVDIAAQLNELEPENEEYENTDAQTFAQIINDTDSGPPDE